MPLSAIPLIKVFCAHRKIIRIGRMERTAPANIGPCCIVCSPWKRARPTGSVCMFWLLVISIGHRKSFQLYMKWKTASVDSDETTTGMMILKKIPNSDSPSILPASMRSFGTERKDCLMK